MSIKTTGELRAFLADTIEKVASGELGVDRAAQIQKLSGQLTESMYAEVKVSALRIQLGRHAGEFGEMSVASHAPEQQKGPETIPEATAPTEHSQSTSTKGNGP